MRWFWQKKNDDDSREMVRIYDFETRKVSFIPAAELAPGMMRAQVEGIPGPVWVDASRLKQNTFQHPPFPEAVRDSLRELKSHLDEVYPMSLEAWEDGFRRDRTPEREIAHWLHLGRVYSHFSSRVPGPENRQRRVDIFRILAGCGISPREQVLKVTERGALSREEAEQIVHAFFSNESALSNIAVRKQDRSNNGDV